MRSVAPALLPILRSRHLAEILAVLLLHPDIEYTLSQLAAALGLPRATVQREVTRLSGAQLIRERRIGRSRLVSADLSNRYARPLAELVTLAFGPQLVIGDVPRRDVCEAAERAEQRLSLPVNPVLCPAARWFAADDPLIQQIRAAPLVWVAGNEPEEGKAHEMVHGRGNSRASARGQAHRASPRCSGRP